MTSTPPLPGTLSPRSRDAYGREIALYEGWCAQQGREAWPCSEEQLAGYARWLACEWRSPLGATMRRAQGPAGKTVASVERAVWVIAAVHRHGGLPVPPMAQALAVNRVARRPAWW